MGKLSRMRAGDGGWGRGDLEREEGFRPSANSSGMKLMKVFQQRNDML